MLGAYGSAESEEAYRRLIAEWMERKGRFAPPVPATPASLSVNELLLAYYKHAVAYYGFDADKRRGDAANLRDALRVVKDLYGSTSARDFGPLALKACRRRMVELGWSRTYVNAQVVRVRRVFRWAVEEELVPAAVLQALRAVDGLRRGKADVRETQKVKPAPVADVEAALPHMSPAVAAMVRLQLLAGMRTGEVLVMRDVDVDTSGDVWVYRPHRHKNRDRGKDRVVFLGPQAQAVLRPWLPVTCPGCAVRERPDRIGWTGTLCGPCHDRREEGEPVNGESAPAKHPPRWLFRPKDTVADLHARRAAARKTKRTPSEERRKSRKEEPRTAHAEKYDRRSYRQAIVRACAVAGVPVWSPLQLRHTAATLIRERYGVEAAQGVLGHSRVETTQVYAERLLGQAARVASEIG
jgi:integrase